MFFRACEGDVVDITEIHFSSRARCASTAAPTAGPATGGIDIPEGLTGERVSGEPPPDVMDIAGLSMRKNEGRPSLPELFPLMAESSLTRGRDTLGRISSKSVSLTCTVSASCNPSSSRADLARSADKEIFERSEPLLPKGAALGADVDEGKDTWVRKSAWRELEPSTSIEPLCRSESEDSRGRDRKKEASFPRAVRLDSVWFSLTEIRIDGGAFTIAALDNEAGTRPDPAPSNFEMEGRGAAGAGAGAGASRSCAGADFGAAERSDGSLFTGVSLRRRVGDVGDETGWPDGDVGTLAAKGDVLGLFVD